MKSFIIFLSLLCITTLSVNAQTANAADTGASKSATLDIPTPETLTFSVFPNPASDMLCIDAGDNETQVSIINASGQEVWRGKVSNRSDAIDISTLSAGVYIVRASSSGLVSSRRKIVVTK